jgi:hypothetical protein
MTWQDYQIEDKILKTSEEKTLWQTEKGVVKIRKNTLVLPILLDGQRNGYVFHGNGELLLDTIVETEEGALGKPVEKEVDKPFLLIGAKEGLLQNLDTAQREGLQKAGYEDEQGFLAEAYRICNRILGRERGCNFKLSNVDRGLVFAFSNETDSPDILLTKGSKLVYKAVGVVFVSSEDKSILKGHGAVVLSHHGKSFLIKR